LQETPDRILRSYEELFAGYNQDPEAILRKSFAMGDYDQMVLVRDIEFASFCEHHWLPFIGRAHVAYLPKGGRVVGLSKLARVVDVFARRLQIQERLTLQIADVMEAVLDPAGVAVVIDAQHQCMTSRGARKPNAGMVTSEMRGAFRDDRKLREEFLLLTKAGR
jgi:GTP cyclohydrolase I